MNEAGRRIAIAFALGACLLAPAAAGGDPRNAPDSTPSFDRVRLVSLPAPEGRRPDPWLVADASALRAIHEEGRLVVQSLVAGFDAADDAGRRALERRITETKRDFELRFLYALVTRALQRGDLDTARQGQEALDRLTAPSPATGPEADPLASKRRAIGKQ